MVEIITELYIEIYWLVYKRLQNEQVAAAVDLLILIIFQLLNIYTVIKLVQRLTSTDFISFLFSKPLIIATICLAIAGFNFFIGRNARKSLKDDDKARFVRRRFWAYAILSVALFAVARFALNSPSS